MDAVRVLMEGAVKTCAVPEGPEMVTKPPPPTPLPVEAALRVPVAEVTVKVGAVLMTLETPDGLVRVMLLPLAAAVRVPVALVPAQVKVGALAVPDGVVIFTLLALVLLKMVLDAAVAVKFKEVGMLLVEALPVGKVMVTVLVEFPARIGVPPPLVGLMAGTLI